MAFDGVLAFRGKNHITASQLGRIVEGVAGKGRYILPTLHGLKATMQTANKVRVDTGDLVMDGRVVTNEKAVDLVVESGTSGYKRNDLVVCHYRKDASTGVETFPAEVIKGTPTTGTPADPTYDAGDISAGGSEAIMPLWRIPIDGITPGTPVQVADTAQSLKSLGDSVSQDLLHRPTCALTATVPGWHGEAVVTTNQFNDETNRWEYDRGSFFQLRLWLWSYNLREDPWTNAVQPPNNPFGANAWCAKVPIKVTDGSFEEVINDVALISVADSGGYLTYQKTYTGHLFLARDGYPYVFVGTKDIFANAAGFVRIDTTVFNSRLNSRA